MKCMAFLKQIGCLTILIFPTTLLSASPVKPPTPATEVPSRSDCALGPIAVDWDFSNDPHDFYLTDCDNGGIQVWEYGPTDYVPDAPARVWGTTLSGDYPDNAGSGLVSPTFYVGGGSWLLEITHYVDTESGYDGCNVTAGAYPSGQILHPDGGYPIALINESQVYYAYCVDSEPGWSGSDAGWRVDCFDLSAFIGQTIAVELDFGSDASVTGPGWYVARIRIGAPTPEVRACCYEDGSCALLIEPQCLEMGGRWQPDDETCDPNPCVVRRYLSIANAFNPEPWNDWVGPPGAVIPLRANLIQDPTNPIQVVEFFRSTDGGVEWEWIGIDGDGTDPRFDSFGDARPDGDGWSLATRVPEEVADPLVRYRAVAFPETGPAVELESACEVDPEPPSRAEINISDWDVFEESEFDLVFDPNGITISRIVVTTVPVPLEFEKGVPAISQHIHSATHCAPTATAQCFRYFENAGDPEITGRLNDYDLVGELGVLMNTNEAGLGTSVSEWAAGTASWIQSHGNRYSVRFRWHYSTVEPIWTLEDWKFARNELEKCQDVLMGVFWDGGGGHAMTLNSIRNAALPNGWFRIGFSDPWTGGQSLAELNPATGRVVDVGGTGGPSGQIGATIVVCPLQTEARFGLPGDLQYDALPPGEPPYAIPINIPDTGGWYVHAAVVNGLGNQYSRSTIIRYDEGSGAPPSTAPPGAFAFLSCRPNPFRTDTELRFDLPRISHVRVEIFDLTGRRVRVVVDEEIPGGRHARTWDGTDERGSHVPAGVYYVRMIAGDFERILKVARVRG